MISPEASAEDPAPAREVEGPEEGPKYLSDAGAEPSAKWIERIESANKPWEDGEAEREMYRDAEWGIFPSVLAGGVTDPIQLLTVTTPPEGPQQVVLNVVSRVIRRAKAKAFDKSPLPKFPRRAKGIEALAEGLEQGLARMSERGGLVRIFRDGVSQIYTDGGFGVFTGLPGLPLKSEVDAMGQSAEEMTDEAATGQAPPPTRYQDHRGAVGALLNVVADPMLGVRIPPEEVKNLEEHVQAHAEAEDAEQAAPSRFEKGTIEWDRLVMGDELRHDRSHPDRKHWRWMARFHLMARREAKALPSLRPEWVDRLPAWEIGRDANGRRVRMPVENVEEDADVMVGFWEVYDRWHWARHFVADGVEGYGEVDEQHPYMKRDGSGPSIRGFFPFTIVAPNTNADGDMIPGVRNFWHQQIELIKLDSAILAVVKRAAIDLYGASSEQYQQIERALREGVGGKVLPFPVGTNVAQAFQALQMQGPIKELGDERERKLLDISIAANVSLSELTSQPQSETLGQEQIVSQGGIAGIADEVKQAEVGYGECLTIAWDIMREHFSIEEVNAQMGGDAQAEWDKWVSSALTDEALTVEFSPASVEHNPEKASTLMALFDKAAAMIDPATGMPAFDGPKLLNMVAKASGLGELPPFQPSPEMLQAMAMGMPPPGAGAPPEGGPPPAESSGPTRASRGRKRGKGGSRGGPGAPADARQPDAAPPAAVGAVTV